MLRRFLHWLRSFFRPKVDWNSLPWASPPASEDDDTFMRDNNP